MLPFADGAFVASKSLLVMVRGDQILQDPLWLDGLPEYVNWDGSVLLGPAVSPSPTLEFGPPPGTRWEAWAGNRHGPGSGTLEWKGRRWARPADPPRIDPRHVTLPTGVADEQLELLVSGHLFVMRIAGGKLEAYVFEAGSQIATRLPLPVVATPSLYRASLVGNSPFDVWFCDREGAIVHNAAGKWSAVAAPRQNSIGSSCAVTTDGVLFWVHWDGNGALFERDDQGAGRRCPCPMG